jgi:hypothetical protein
MDKPSYATVWVEVEVPWSFTGRGALFEINGNFEGAVNRIGNFFDLAGAYMRARGIYFERACLSAMLDLAFWIS